MHPSTKSPFARYLLRGLHSDLTFLIVGALVTAQLLFSNIQSTWMAILLVFEYTVRVCCYSVLSTHSLRAFLAAKSNLCDLVVAISDTAFLCAYFGETNTLLSDIIVTYARNVRILRLSRLAPPVLNAGVSLFKSTLRYLFGCIAFLCRGCHCAETNDREEQDKANSFRGRVVVVESYVTFRRYISAMSQNEAKAVWPLSEYSYHFCAIASYDGSTIHVDDLPALLHNLGFEGTTALKDLSAIVIDDTTDRNVVFFDALVEALSLVRDRKMERKILMPLEPRRLRAQRSIQLVATRVVLFVATFFVLMISALTDLAVNIYILTAGLVSDETLDTGAYANQFSVAVEQTPFGALDRALSNLFRLLSDVVRLAGDKLTINLTWDSGVTCSGVNSMLALPILCFVTASKVTHIPNP